jgi:hypothetical protein
MMWIININYISQKMYERSRIRVIQMRNNPNEKQFYFVLEYIFNMINFWFMMIYVQQQWERVKTNVFIVIVPIEYLINHKIIT